jgi:regulator of replication initiation timing
MSSRSPSPSPSEPSDSEWTRISVDLSDLSPRPPIPQEAPIPPLSGLSDRLANLRVSSDSEEEEERIRMIVNANSSLSFEDADDPDTEELIERLIEHRRTREQREAQTALEHARLRGQEESLPPEFPSDDEEIDLESYLDSDNHDQDDDDGLPPYLNYGSVSHDVFSPLRRDSPSRSHREEEEQQQEVIRSVGGPDRSQPPPLPPSSRTRMVSEPRPRRESPPIDSSDPSSRPLPPVIQSDSDDDEDDDEESSGPMPAIRMPHGPGGRVPSRSDTRPPFLFTPVPGPMSASYYVAHGPGGGGGGGDPSRRTRDHRPPSPPRRPFDPRVPPPVRSYPNWYSMHSSFRDGRVRVDPEGEWAMRMKALPHGDLSSKIIDLKRKKTDLKYRASRLMHETSQLRIENMNLQRRINDLERRGGRGSEDLERRVSYLQHKIRIKKDKIRRLKNSSSFSSGKFSIHNVPSTPYAASESIRSLSDEESASALNQFKCPISMEVMTDPVVAPDGHTYERKEITLWFSKSKRSPVTNEELPHLFLVPNYTLRSLILDTFPSLLPQ